MGLHNDGHNTLHYPRSSCFSQDNSCRCSSGNRRYSIWGRYLGTLGFAYILFALMFVSNGVINGSGRTIITMSITVFVGMAGQAPAGRSPHRQTWHKGIWLAVVIGFAVGLAASLCY